MATAVEPDAPLDSTPKDRAHVVIKWSIVTARIAKQTKTRPRFFWSKATFDDLRALKHTLATHDRANRFVSLESADDCYNELVKVYTDACYEHIPKTTTPAKTKRCP